jgi:hypothetical protein
MAAEDLVPDVTLGEIIAPNSVIQTMRCDEDNVRKGRFVTITAGENWPPVCHEADAGETVGGIALKAGSNGDYIPVLTFGPVKMYAGGAVVAGVAVKTDNEGRATAAVAADQGLEGGKALMSAGEADDQFIVFVNPSTPGRG